jgi:hypothetical protein
MAGRPKGVIVGQALVAAGVGLTLGHGAHFLFNKIDQADILHSPLLVAVGMAADTDGRSGSLDIDGSWSTSWQEERLLGA